eukprot:4976079-Heterocapsa_arctica.AAC.1
MLAQPGRFAACHSCCAAAPPVGASSREQSRWVADGDDDGVEGRVRRLLAHSPPQRADGVV